tara:strand:- start:474 stop:1592 length:1119 start_codon:yes stop_codon:yes gene_type:complete
MGLRPHLGDCMDLKTWVFEISQGNYEIDLGDSNAPCRNINEIAKNIDQVLDYGWDQGHSNLRKEVAKLYDCDAEEILITHGAQEALFLVYLNLIDIGDEVILPTPGWPQSLEAPTRLGAKVVAIPSGSDGEINIEGIISSINDNTKLIVLNSPGNPTTYEVTESDVVSIVDAIGDRDIFVIFDDEYLVDLRQSMHKLISKSVSVSSISKVYGFPGLRVGWVKADRKLVDDLRDMKHLTTISNSILNEKLALKILEDKDKYLSSYKYMWGAGKKLILDWVKTHSSIFTEVHISSAPFAWIKVTERLSSLEFCTAILEEEGIMLMPSEVFGVENHIRLTFVREGKELEKALEKISHQINLRYSLVENYHESVIC